MMADNLMEAFRGKGRAEKVLSCFRCGFSRCLAFFSPAQHRTRGDHQQFEEILTGVVVTRILQIRKASEKCVHGFLSRSIPWVKILLAGFRKPNLHI